MGIAYWASPRSVTLNVPSTAPTSVVSATWGGVSPPIHLPFTQVAPSPHAPQLARHPVGSGPHSRPRAALQAEMHCGGLGQAGLLKMARDGSSSVQPVGTHVPLKQIELPWQSTLEVQPACPSPQRPRQNPPHPSPLSTSAQVFWLHVVWHAQLPHGAFSDPHDLSPAAQMGGQHTLTLPRPNLVPLPCPQTSPVAAQSAFVVQIGGVAVHVPQTEEV